MPFLMFLTVEITLFGSGGVTGGPRLLPLDGGGGSIRSRRKGVRAESVAVGGELLLAVRGEYCVKKIGHHGEGKVGVTRF